MVEDSWTDAAARQLWAEGIDWRAGFPSDATADSHRIAELLQRRAELPTRDAFKYPGPEQTRVIVPLVAVFVDRYHLVPWLERLWGGALQGIGVSHIQDGRLDRIAHWRLNLLFGRRGFPTAERMVELWAEHPTQVQDTPAEQQILRWYMAHEPWLARWHPYREGSGAMRRAPLWGAIYRVPQQAAGEAASDARTSYGGWGIWTAAVVAYAVSALPQDWTPDDATGRLLDAMTRVDPQWLGIANLHTLLRTVYPGASWDAWRHVVDTEFAGYPRDHSLPNLLLILGALHWHAAADSGELGDVLQGAGWDAMGNRLVAGALMGRRGNQINGDRDDLNLLVEATVKAHGHPPHAGDERPSTT